MTVKTQIILKKFKTLYSADLAWSNSIPDLNLLSKCHIIIYICYVAIYVYVLSLYGEDLDLVS